MSASIGVAVRPPSGGDELLKDAEIAMRRAKERGRNGYEFFTREMNVRVLERLTLGNMLRRALKREEFRLCYQPRVDLATGGIVVRRGARLLLRQAAARRGHHPPPRGGTTPALGPSAACEIHSRDDVESGPFSRGGLRGYLLEARAGSVQRHAHS